MATTATNVNLENLRRSYKAFGAGDMGTLSEHATLVEHPDGFVEHRPKGAGALGVAGLTGRLEVSRDVEDVRGCLHEPKS